MPAPQRTKFQIQFSETEVPLLAQRYGPENDNPALEAGQRIANGDYSRNNLVDIFDWKTRGRGRSRLERNCSEEIRDALRMAANAQTDRAAVAVLVGLVGVNVPVASAILTAIDPQRYTVIDFRALEALGVSNPSMTINFYLDYLDHCRGLARRSGVPLRDLDRALWQWSKERKRQHRKSDD